MDPNILLHEPPQSVALGGGSVRIRTQYRVWIAVERLCDDPALSPAERGERILQLAFDADQRTGEAVSPLMQALAAPGEALDAALLFFNFNEPRRPQTARQRKLAHIRSFDWDWDAYMVIADFQHLYGIDLTDPALRMHWWRFWSLFRGMGDGSHTMDAIRVRTAEEDGLSGEARSALRERKQMLMLPARTREEVERNRNLRWGQDV